MTRDEVYAVARAFSDESPLNRVREDAALRPDLAGMRMYAPPLMGVAAAGDPLFAELRRPGVIGRHFQPPRDWLPEAESVISFFHPFTDQVIASNRVDPEDPSAEWLHARIEGQTYIDNACRRLVDALRAAGFKAVAPSVDERFWLWAKPAGRRDDGTEVPGFTSNWSERHVAHVAGLGTFGLSAAFITQQGVGGRLGSVVTNLRLEPDVRPYSRHDEYCNHCGACVKACPVGAITPGVGKDKAVCSRRVDLMKEKHAPRYGCAKCNVKAPCARSIPAGV